MRILLCFSYPFFCQCAGIFPQIWNYYFNHVTVNVMSVRYENWITVLYLISYLLHAVTSHRSATTLKPPTAEGNNIHPLVTMQCSAGRNKKNLGSWHSCGCFFSTNIQEKHRCTPSASRHGNGTPQGQCDQEPQGVQLNSKFP